MEFKANILVTEVFDTGESNKKLNLKRHGKSKNSFTELIGEGAISVFNHAHENLLTNDCYVVPTSGTMYAQVIN